MSKKHRFLLYSVGLIMASESWMVVLNMLYPVHPKGELFVMYGILILFGLWIAFKNTDYPKDDNKKPESEA